MEQGEMTYEVNPIHAHEREEARDAREFAICTACYRHTYRSDRHGGGVCIDCGDYLNAEEL
jgi:hypothetical protein